MKKNGFTLLELLIVVVIIAVLAILLIPNFRPARESALNNEARANLKLLQAAEKIYRLEYGVYLYTDHITTTDEDYINSMLKVSLTNATPLKWDYQVANISAGADFNATALRNVTGDTYYTRTMWINRTLEDPICNDPANRFCK